MPIVHRVGHVPPLRSRLWSCESHKRAGIGDIDESRVRSPILGPSWPAVRSLQFWNGTGWSRQRSGAGRQHQGVSESALGDGCGFFIVGVWTRRGLQRFVVLFFISLSTRKVEFAGIAQAAKDASAGVENRLAEMGDRALRANDGEVAAFSRRPRHTSSGADAAL